MDDCRYTRYKMNFTRINGNDKEYGCKALLNFLLKKISLRRDLFVCLFKGSGCWGTVCGRTGCVPRRPRR